MSYDLRTCVDIVQPKAQQCMQAVSSRSVTCKYRENVVHDQNLEVKKHETIKRFQQLAPSLMRIEIEQRCVMSANRSRMQQTFCSFYGNLYKPVQNCRFLGLDGVRFFLISFCQFPITLECGFFLKAVLFSGY